MGKTKGRRRGPAVVRAGARGLVAAMAMTGTRTVTAAVGPHEKSPPEAIVDEHAPRQIRELSSRHREALTELAHWGYGTAGGVAFGLLPRRFRGHVAAGPLYGLALWLTFELAIAPALGVAHARRHQALWRAVIAGDHVLYGVMVAGRLAPEPRTRP
ncbi:MAG TPA: hypothetical protein VFU43_29550 [Streptosporangiaceae bacterium]|nr:hypothetical protein [Streptosporangiaceae bacterium]